MSLLGAAQYQAVVLKQGAAVLAKDVYVNVGWRPKICRVTRYTAAGGEAIAIDGVLTAAAELPGGLKLATQAAASAAVGEDGITFTDVGVKIGQDAAIMATAAAHVLVELFRPTPDVAVVDLDDIDVVTSSFGKGEQYGSKVSSTGVRTYQGEETAVTDGGVTVTKAA